ncbi:MAG: MBL fold metallo-hydrolase [archaeon]|nr:MBL fold metallo-hydrolase [archaeon]
MKLTVLNDNTAGRICPAEFGLSFLLEEDKKVLFDLGPSDIFIRNAKALNISLEDIDCIVLSHGHWDHGNGLKFIKNKKLICHPDCFIKRYLKKDDAYIGMPLTLEEAKNNFELILIKDPYQISQNIIFLGEIPRKNSFESTKTPFYKDEKKDDFVMDDSAIAINSQKGLIIITGCSHAGICNIAEHAKKVTGIEKIHAVIGGFHLKYAGEITGRTIEYFKKEKIEKIYPSHCTELPALSKFYEAFKIEQIHSGDVIRL